MRINNPRLFNGELLASYKRMAELLGLNLTADGAIAEDGFGLLSSSIIPISGVNAQTVDGKSVFPIFGDTIKVDDGEGAKTLKQAIEDAAATAAYDSNVSGKADEAITVEYSSGYYDTVNNTGLSEQFTVGLKLDSTDNVLSQSANGLKANLALVKQGEADAGYAATYALSGINGILGEKINIPQDQLLSGVQFVQGAGAGDDVLRFTFLVADPAGTDTTTQTVDVPLSGLFDEYTGVNGVAVVANAAGDGYDIKGVVDPDPANEFLTVGANGFMVSGVTDKIQAASGYALDLAKAYTDEVSGALSATITGYVDNYNTTVVQPALTAITDDIQTVSSAVDSVIVSGATIPTEVEPVAYGRLYVDDQQKAAIVPSGATAPISISMRSTDNLSTAAADDLAEAQAVTGYVEPIKTALENKIQYVSGVVSAATTIISAEVTFGGGTTGQVPGPVLSVYGADGEQCSPYVKYTAPNSVLSADLATAETFVVYYAKNVKNA